MMAGQAEHWHCRVYYEPRQQRPVVYYQTHCSQRDQARLQEERHLATQIHPMILYFKPFFNAINKHS